MSARSGGSSPPARTTDDEHDHLHRACRRTGGGARPRRLGPGAGARIAWIVAWMVVATLAWVTFTRVFGITFPARLTVMLQAIVPIVYLPVYPIGVVAFLRRRWYLGGACVLLAVVHVAAVYPALGRRPLPAWAVTAPRLTILEANVYDQNAEPDAAAAKILASGADVLVVVEMDSRTLQALRRPGRRPDLSVLHAARRPVPHRCHLVEAAADRCAQRGLPDGHAVGHRRPSATGRCSSWPCTSTTPSAPARTGRGAGRAEDPGHLRARRRRHHR